jgi:hypothetical protein
MRTLALLACVVFAGPVLAQPLARRVEAAPDGAVRLSYPAHEGVCGKGGNYWSRDRGDDNWTGAGCEAGPVRVQLETQGGAVVRLRSYVGGNWLPRSGVTDLGDVDAGEAQSLLLDLAKTASPRVAADALTPAVLAAAPDPWQRLLALARDASRTEDVRKQSIFWLGQSAAREATAGLAAIAEGDPATELQKTAVFALSQGRDPARVDELMKVAKAHRNPEVVKSALFWLAQSEDPRALGLFEEILTR